MSGTNSELVGGGVTTAAISSAMVSLLHSYTGRGPTRARTTIDRDLIVCVMGAALTKGEQSLVRDGQHEVVLHGRRAFQKAMRSDAINAVQELSGRRVVAFMSNNHIDPDLAVEVFILEPEADTPDVRDEREEMHDGNGMKGITG
jgi:uncharacterized protein YbcI